jgi:signal transduction histidine kinase
MLRSTGIEERQRVRRGIDDSSDGARDDVANADRYDTTLVRRYHATRLMIATAMALLSLWLSVAWDWPPGLIVTGAGMTAAADALMRYKGYWSRAALLPLLVDATAVGIATLFGQLPEGVMVYPVFYMVVSAFALMKVWPALWYVPYPVLWLVLNVFVIDATGWSSTEMWILRAIAFVIYLPGMVAILIVASSALESTQQLDRQLVSSKRQLELTVTGAPVILFEYNNQGVFTLSEGAGLEKLGLVPGQVVGLSALDVYAQAPEVLSGVKRSLQGESFSDVAQVGDVFFQVQYRAQVDEHGDLERVIGVATDISERVAAEAALEALVRSKDQFVATIAHELRTPLTAVVGLSEELRSSYQVFEPDEIVEFIHLIADQGHEVAAIVEDLLVAARADMGKVSVVTQEVDLERSVEGVLTETNHLRTSSTTAISLVGNAGLAVADPQRVRQILRNLMTNAFRYGGAHVWIELASETKWSKVVVADNGSGVPASEQNSIFEPFRRAHDEPGLPGSLGLGLFVARKLAEMMHGSLTYRRVGTRTEFELALPASRKEVTQLPEGTVSSVPLRN